MALLFLTRGPMFHDKLWKAWMQAARGLIPVEQLAGIRAGGKGGAVDANAPVCGFAADWEAGSFSAGARGAREALTQQFLFSLYVHPAPDWPGYEESSVFWKLELPMEKRIAVSLRLRSRPGMLLCPA